MGNEEQDDISSLQKNGGYQQADGQCTSNDPNCLSGFDNSHEHKSQEGDTPCYRGSPGDLDPFHDFDNLDDALQDVSAFLQENDLDSALQATTKRSHREREAIYNSGLLVGASGAAPSGEHYGQISNEITALGDNGRSSSMAIGYGVATYPFSSHGDSSNEHTASNAMSDYSSNHLVARQQYMGEAPANTAGQNEVRNSFSGQDHSYIEQLLAGGLIHYSVSEDPMLQLGYIGDDFSNMTGRDSAENRFSAQGTSDHTESFSESTSVNMAPNNLSYQNQDQHYSGESSIIRGSYIAACDATSDGNNEEPVDDTSQTSGPNDHPLFDRFSAPAVYNRVINGPDVRHLPSYGDLDNSHIPQPIDHGNPSSGEVNGPQREASGASLESGTSLQTERSIHTETSFQTDASLNVAMQGMQPPSAAQKGKQPIRMQEDMRQENEAEIRAREIDRQRITPNALEGFGISFDFHDPLVDFDQEFEEELGEEDDDYWGRDPSSQIENTRTKSDKFGFFERLDRYPEVCLAIARQLKVEEFVSLYCISKDFHAAVDQHMTTCILDNVSNMCRESAKAFRFTMYDKLLTPDPTDRLHPTRPWLVRRVPGLRYLRMVHHREKMVRDILACLARQGHRTPEGMSNSLKKMWLLMDLSTTRQRVMFMHSQKYFTDMDLYNIQMFVIKLDMRFNDPIDGPGDDAVRIVMLGQRGLTPLRNLLRRNNVKSLEDIIKIQVRYDYKVRPDHMGWGIWGIPPAEIGIGHLEGWGQGLLHLMRPDELVVREAVRRGLDLKNHLMMMMLWGYVDPITGENTPATEEEMYMSDEEPVSMKYRWKEPGPDDEEDEDEEMDYEVPESPQQETIEELVAKRRAERQAQENQPARSQSIATQDDFANNDKNESAIDAVNNQAFQSVPDTDDDGEEDEDEEDDSDAYHSDDSYHSLSEYDFGEEDNGDQISRDADTEDDPYSRNVRNYEKDLMNDAISEDEVVRAASSIPHRVPVAGLGRGGAKNQVSASNSSAQAIPGIVPLGGLGMTGDHTQSLQRPAPGFSSTVQFGPPRSSVPAFLDQQTIGQSSQNPPSGLYTGSTNSAQRPLPPSINTRFRPSDANVSSSQVTGSHILQAFMCSSSTPGFFSAPSPLPTDTNMQDNSQTPSAQTPRGALSLAPPSVPIQIPRRTRTHMPQATMGSPYTPSEYSVPPSLPGYTDTQGMQSGSSSTDPKPVASTSRAPRSFMASSQAPTFRSMQSSTLPTQYPTAAASTSRQQTPAFGSLQPAALPTQYPTTPSTFSKASSATNPRSITPPSANPRTTSQSRHQTHSSFAMGAARASTSQASGGRTSQPRYQIHTPFSMGTASVSESSGVSNQQPITPSGFSNQRVIPGGLSSGGAGWGSSHAAVEDADCEEEEEEEL